jgi:hypothetical protein
VDCGLYFAPHSWNPPPFFVYSCCPACVLMMFDPSLSTVLLMLTPANAPSILA